MKFFRLLLVLLLLPFVGTIGFVYIEGWRPLDALYMSFITLSTVGYGVIAPLSDYGKIFIICYLATSLSLFLYSIAQIGEMAVSGELNRFLGVKLMKRTIFGLKDHYIICGAGKMGRAVAQKLSLANKKFVIIDKDQAQLELIKKNGWRYIEGDATEDGVLMAAGVDSAQCLATVLSNDADNLFVVMSTRLIASTITIITRAKEESSINKLKRAGADKVVSPYVAGANKVSQLMINPQLEEFYELFRENDLGVDLTIVQVDDNSRFLNKHLSELNLNIKGVMIVGIMKSNGKLLLPPPVDQALELNDSLIAIGKELAIEKIFSLTLEEES